MIVDHAVYRDGRRVGGARRLRRAARRLPGEGAVAWIGLYESSSEEFAAVAREFGLHDLAVEDAVKAHQRAEARALWRHACSSSCDLPATWTRRRRSCSARSHIFVGPQFVITVRHGDAPELGPVRRRLEARPDLLRRGPLAILYAIVDHVVDGYAAGRRRPGERHRRDRGRGLRAASPTVSRRIYELTREVIEFQRATGRSNGDSRAAHATSPEVDDEERRLLARRPGPRHSRRRSSADAFRALLQNILDVNLTLETKALSEASHAQNEQVKRISAWAAILFAPTLVGTIYGMNFEHMPELGWTFGYPVALALMVPSRSVSTSFQAPPLDLNLRRRAQRHGAAG